MRRAPRVSTSVPLIQRFLLVSRSGCRPPVTTNEARLSSSLEVLPAKTLILPFSTMKRSRLL